MSKPLQIKIIPEHNQKQIPVSRLCNRKRTNTNFDKTKNQNTPRINIQRINQLSQQIMKLTKNQLKNKQNIQKKPISKQKMQTPKNRKHKGQFSGGFGKNISLNHSRTNSIKEYQSLKGNTPRQKDLKNRIRIGQFQNSIPIKIKEVSITDVELEKKEGLNLEQQILREISKLKQKQGERIQIEVMKQNKKIWQAISKFQSNMKLMMQNIVNKEVGIQNQRRHKQTYQQSEIQNKLYTLQTTHHKQITLLTNQISTLHQTLNQFSNKYDFILKQNKQLTKKHSQLLYRLEEHMIFHRKQHDQFALQQKHLQNKIQNLHSLKTQHEEDHSFQNYKKTPKYIYL